MGTSIVSADRCSAINIFVVDASPSAGSLLDGSAAAKPNGNVDIARVRREGTRTFVGYFNSNSSRLSSFNSTLLVSSSRRRLLPSTRLPSRFVEATVHGIRHAEFDRGTSRDGPQAVWLTAIMQQLPTNLLSLTTSHICHFLPPFIVSVIV